MGSIWLSWSPNFSFARRTLSAICLLLKMPLKSPGIHRSSWSTLVKINRRGISTKSIYKKQIYFIAEWKLLHNNILYYCFSIHWANMYLVHCFFVGFHFYFIYFFWIVNQWNQLFSDNREFGKKSKKQFSTN